MADKEVTKEGLYKELTKRIEKQLAMIENLERLLEQNCNDAEALIGITKAYNNIVTLYNSTCANLIQLKRWNYADEDEKKKEIEGMRKLMVNTPMPGEENVQGDKEDED